MMTLYLEILFHLQSVIIAIQNKFLAKCQMQTPSCKASKDVLKPAKNTASTILIVFELDSHTQHSIMCLEPQERPETQQNDNMK